jgi:hypothetical protein
LFPNWEEIRNKGLPQRWKKTDYIDDFEQRVKSGVAATSNDFIEHVASLFRVFHTLKNFCFMKIVLRIKV